MDVVGYSHGGLSVGESSHDQDIMRAAKSKVVVDHNNDVWEGIEIDMSFVTCRSQ